MKTENYCTHLLGYKNGEPFYGGSREKEDSRSLVWQDCRLCALEAERDSARAQLLEAAETERHLQSEIEGWIHKVDDLIKQTDTTEKMLKDEAKGWQLDCFDARRNAKEQQAEIDRVKEMDDYIRWENDKLLDDNFALTFARNWYKARARAWKTTAKYWYDFASEYFLREQNLPMDSTVVRNNKNEWAAFDALSPKWRDEARAYLRGEIELETPTDNKTSRKYNPPRTEKEDPDDNTRR